MNTLKRVTSLQVFRYGSSGIVSIAIEYGTFLVFFYLLRLQINISITLSFLIVLVIGFVLSKYWVFHGDQGRRTAHQFLLYCALASLNLVFSNLTIPCLHTLGIEPAIGKLLTMGVVATWNFFIQKRGIFH